MGEMSKSTMREDIMYIIYTHNVKINIYLQFRFRH